MERSAELRVQLLGGFRVWAGGRPVAESAWRRRKAANLIKLLALTPRHRLHRERVLELLWPELEPEAAANNLHATLHHARRALEPAGSSYLRFQGVMLVLSPTEPVWVDVEAFEMQALSARRGKDPAAYQAALGLYSGDLLPDDHYEDWVISRREELLSLYLKLALELGKLHEGRESHEAAIAAFQRVLAREAAHEEAHRGLMRCYALLGQRHQALRQFQKLREVLARELEAEPDAASQALYADILAGRFPADARALEPAAVREMLGDIPGNLPVPPDRFIGREGELAELESLLQATRLLTLSGAPGAGKSRLALELASRQRIFYPDGVWLVELAALADPELLPQAVLKALGGQEAPGRSPLEALQDYPSQKQLLLLLDNCEHLLDACSRLLEALLKSCPRLKVLATSREALHLTSELAWNVPPLSTPDPPMQFSSLEALKDYDAVRLFLKRARSHRSTFNLAPENASAVVQVCSHLEGLPLALELAAARVSVLSVAQIAERLDDSLRLLKSSQALPSRHRTLQAALDWSHDLLSEEEQIFFRRLTVFAGGWSLRAAEAVCAGEGVESTEVLDLTASLAEKSLLIVSGKDGRARYRLLEPIRQYAEKKLLASGEADVVRERHLEWFLGLVEKAEPELTGPEQAVWLQRLEAEHDNLRAAIAWAQEKGESALRLAGALWRFWYKHGHLSEGVAQLDRALAQESRNSSVLVATRAEALRGLGILSYMLGDNKRASQLYLEALASFQEAGDKKGAAATLDHLAMVAHYQGNHERAAALYQEALDLQQALGDKRGTASTLNNLGNLAQDRGDYQQATARWNEALGMFRAVGDKHSVAGLLCNLAKAACAQGKYERAAALYQESLEMFREIDDKLSIAGSLEGLGVVAYHWGEREQAEAHFTEALALSRELGDRWGIALVLCKLGRLAQLQGEPRRAAALYEESLHLHRELEYKQGIAASLEGLASVAEQQGELERAVALLSEGLTLYSEVSDKLGVATCLEGLAAIAGGQGRAAHAARLLGAAAKLRTDLGAALPSSERAVLDRRVDFVRRALGQKEYELAWEGGRTLPLEQVVTEALNRAEPATAAPPAKPLSRREQEIAALIAKGFTNRQIAAELKMSERTADTHVSHILRKLGFKSRVQLAAWAKEQGLLEDDTSGGH